jgi:NADPH:quinone reductase-like Zn-dependent oxidoreductase
MKALVFKEFGPPDVLHIAEVPEPALGPRDVLVRIAYAGLNFADVYRRQGNYHLKGNSPWILGYEGSGHIEALGADVAGLRIGDRVAFADSPFSNAELTAVDADKIIPVPSDITLEIAAAVLLQGLTAQYLVSDSYNIRPRRCRTRSCRRWRGGPVAMPVGARQRCQGCGDRVIRCQASGGLAGRRRACIRIRGLARDGHRRRRRGRRGL